MERARGARDDEVVDEPPVPPKRLGADPHRPRGHVGGPQLGHEAAQLGDERAPAGDGAQLAQPVAPVRGREAPGPGPAERVGEVMRADPAQLVCVAGPDEER